jgi:hypothetical protein
MVHYGSGLERSPGCNVGSLMMTSPKCHFQKTGHVREKRLQCLTGRENVSDGCTSDPRRSCRFEEVFFRWHAGQSRMWPAGHAPEATAGDVLIAHT